MSSEMEGEAKTLRKISSKASAFVGKFIQTAVVADRTCIVMEMLGQNVSELIDMLPRPTIGAKRLSPITVARIAINMLRCIEAVHDTGYIHRDIKPSNFVRGARAGGGGGGNKHRRFYLIDLGMSRGYLDKEKNVRKARTKCEFRGTSKYASLNSHEHKDLGRRDDLWSFCFATLQVRGRGRRRV